MSMGSDIRAEMLAAHGIETVEVNGDFVASKIKSPKKSFREKIEGYPETIDAFTSTDFAYMFKILSVQMGNDDYNISLSRDSACFAYCMKKFGLTKDKLYRLLRYTFSKRQKRVIMGNLYPTIFRSEHMVKMLLEDMRGLGKVYGKKLIATDNEWSGVLKKARDGAYN